MWTLPCFCSKLTVLCEIFCLYVNAMWISCVLAISVLGICTSLEAFNCGARVLNIQFMRVHDIRTKEKYIVWKCTTERLKQCNYRLLPNISYFQCVRAEDVIKNYGPHQFKPLCHQSALKLFNGSVETLLFLWFQFLGLHSFILVISFCTESGCKM